MFWSEPEGYEYSNGLCSFNYILQGILNSTEKLQAVHHHTEIQPLSIASLYFGHGPSGATGYDPLMQTKLETDFLWLCVLITTLSVKLLIHSHLVYHFLLMIPVLCPCCGSFQKATSKVDELTRTGIQNDQKITSGVLHDVQFYL